MNKGISRRTFGNMAEVKVRLYLLFRGYVILETNYFTPGGEIDIIAKKNGTLVFVEVRSKKDTSLKYGSPLETVDKEKQKSIVTSARYYLNTYPEGHKDYRFDVAGVITRKNGTSAVEYIKNAFYTT